MSNLKILILLIIPILFLCGGGVFPANLLLTSLLKKLSHFKKRLKSQFSRHLSPAFLVSLSLCVLTLFAPLGAMCFSLPPAHAATLKTFPKYTYSKHMTVPDPNVLFLLDTGAQMTFTTDGVLPRGTDSHTEAERLVMMQDCTYGYGLRHFNVLKDMATYYVINSNGRFYLINSFNITNDYIFSIKQSVFNPPYVERNMYGNDLDASNNIGVVNSSLHSYCYYTPDESNQYFLTYRDKNSPSSGLVPNDSRMYKMKLALWRLLKPETDPVAESLAERWKKILSRFNIGIATTYGYKDLTATNQYTAFNTAKDTTATTLRATGFGVRNFYFDLKSYKPEKVRDFLGIPSYQGESFLVDAFSNFVYEAYGEDSYGNAWASLYKMGLGQWLFDNRSRLIIPIGKFYYKKEDVIASSQTLVDFLTYIDGEEDQNEIFFENYDTYYKDFTYLLKDKLYIELPLSVRSNIATSIYGRDYFNDLGVAATASGTGNLPAISYEYNYHDLFPQFLLHYKNMVTTSTLGNPLAMRYGLIKNTSIPREYATRIISYFPGFLNYAFDGQYSQYDLHSSGSVKRYPIDTANHAGNPAVGSVLDFFSPYPYGESNSVFCSLGGGLKFDGSNLFHGTNLIIGENYNWAKVDNTNSTTFKNDTAVGNFPILGGCQRNYLVIFTAGDNDELSGKEFEDSGGTINRAGTYVRTAPEAALELYKKSTGPQTEYPIRGTDIFDVQNGILQIREGQYDMETGIKTLVVGMVDADSPKVSALRNQLNDIAASGQPKWDSVHKKWVPNEAKKAIFLSKRPSVAEGMRDFIQEIREKIFKKILVEYITDREDNSHIYATSPAPLIRLDTDGKTGRIYRAYFKKNKTDQWLADFNCLNLVLDNGDVEERNSPWTAEAGRQMSDKGLSRNLFTSAGSQESTNTSLLNLRSIDFSSLATAMDLAGVDSATLSKFKNWLLNPDSDGLGEYTDITPMGDMQNSNFLYISREGSHDNIYFQTNRGTIHELDAETGQENWAFIPPNIFQGRLKYLKFGKDNRYFNTYPDYGWRSLPLNLLDGKLSTTKIGDQRILIGTLGRGGNGLYAMDITTPNDPQFLWAVENPRYDTTEGVIKWGDTSSTGNYDYSQLSLTTAGISLVPLTDTVKIGLLSGGIAYNLTSSNNQGRVLYVINPSNGSILTALSMMNSEPIGMIIASPTLIPSISEPTILGGFFVGDSNGNILYAKPNDSTGRNWSSLKSIFHLQNSGSNLAITHGLLAVKDKLDPSLLHLFGGSGNIEGPDRYTKKDNAIICNQHYIFSVTTPQEPESAATFSISDLAERTLDTLSNSNLPAPTISANGWYVKLRAKNDAAEAEELSIDPYLKGQMVCLATYVVSNTDLDEKLAGLACPLPLTSTSRIYFLDPFSGKAVMDMLELPGVKVTALTSIGNKVIISVQNFAQDAVDYISDNRVSTLNPTTLVFTPPDEPEPASIPISGVPYSEFTRDFSFTD